MSPRAGPLRVALLGLGTVGREVARGLHEGAARLALRTGGRELRLVAVGVRDPSRRRDLALPAGTRVTADLPALAQDPDVDVLVELLGGLAPAADLIAAALERGGSVVTANKALLARRGAELESLARSSGSSLRFEAAVGGGVPILAPLAADLAADTVTSLAGIVNGTTNYILGQMQERGLAYGEVLQEAQALGYAEADPRADVEGDDAADKLVVLIRLAFGGWVERQSVLRGVPSVRGDGQPGIVSIEPDELDAAAVLDGTVKLLATARRAGETAVEASVVPTLVPARTPLASTDGARNRIEVVAEPVGSVGFDGPGAGGAPTSSAVLGDIVAIARGLGSTWAGLPEATALALAGDGLRGAGLAGPRTWFAYLRGVDAADLPQSLVATAVDGPHGTALMSRPVAIDELRPALAAVLGRSVDASLYPLHEAA